MENFMSQVLHGYVRHKNPYHNDLHAADVTQTVHYMLCQQGLAVSILSTLHAIYIKLYYIYLQLKFTNTLNIRNLRYITKLYVECLFKLNHSEPHSVAVNDTIKGCFNNR